MKISNVIFSAIFVLGFANCAYSQPEITFDNQGLSSVHADAPELLANGQIELRQRLIWPGEVPPAKPPRITFEQTDHMLRQQFDWGTILCTYQAQNDRLNLDLKITNTTKADIRFLELAMMRLKFAGNVKIDDRSGGWPNPINPADEPTVAVANYQGGSAAWCCEDIGQAVQVHMEPAGGSGEYALIFKLPGPPISASIAGQDWARISSLIAAFGKRRRKRRRTRQRYLPKSRGQISA